jgi:DNA-binding NarL/FixJ family response regulator
MNSKITIGIAEDQQIFRKGLISLINSFESMQVTHEAENGSQLLDLMRKNCPQVVILDYSMPLLNGIETTKAIRLNFPAVKIILLSMYEAEEFVEAAINAGANSYLSKDDDLSEINKAIEAVLHSNYYLNDRVSAIMIGNLIKSGKIDPKYKNNSVEFSPDEIKVIDLISKEFTTQQIADKLFKSTRTIEKYRTKMMERVGASNSVGLIMYAVKNKIIVFNS